MMMKSVLLLWTPSLNNRSKLKGQYTDIKSGCGISVGSSLKPQSQFENFSRETVPLMLKTKTILLTYLCSPRLLAILSTVLKRNPEIYYKATISIEGECF